MKNAEMLPVVGTSTDGKQSLYYIDPETRTCKKVVNTMTDRFTEPEDMAGLDAKSAKINTQVLHEFLKSKDFPVSYAGSRADLKVRCYDYEFQYTPNGFGFECRDMRNSFAQVTLEEGLDFPTPEAVARFLQRTKDRPSIDAASGTFKVLGRTERLTVNPDTGAVEIAEQRKSSTKESLEDALDRIFSDLRAKNYTIRDAGKEIQKFITDSRHKNRVGRVFKSTANVKLLEAEVRKILAEDFKVKAAKFEYFDFPYDRITSVRYSKEVGTVVYTFEGHDRKHTNITEERSLHGFLWRIALHLYPKAMQLMMKVAAGEFKYDGTRPPHGFKLKDPYQEFNKTLLDNPKTDDAVAALVELCDDIIAWMGEPDPIEVIYPCLDHDYKKGDKLKVYWPDYREWYVGEVVETVYGVNVRYEDGTAAVLCTHHRVRRLK